MSLDTTIEGAPGAIEAVADWLRSGLAEGAEGLGSEVFRERSRSGSSWDGAAGDAFRGRAGTLGKAADDTASEARAVAAALDVLAAAMRRAQEGMSQARATATAGGLTVRGNLIEPPDAVPPPVAAHNATSGEIAAYERGIAAIEAYEALVRVWEEVGRRVAEHFADWDSALQDAASTWNAHQANLTGVTADFLTAGVGAAYILRVAPILTGQAQFERGQAARLRAHASSTLRAGRLVGGSRGGYYDLLERAAQADGRAASAAGASRDVRVPRGIGRALGVLGIAATGYAIADDIEQGESPAQAAVSNGAGMLAAIGASAAAGAGIGAVAGSLIPVPGVGTAVGVVGGAVVGTVLGTFTSGAVDSLWESGADSLGDVGNALSDGWDEVADTGAAIGDLAEDAWDAIF
jgi:hypothetical protein